MPEILSTQQIVIKWICDRMLYHEKRVKTSRGVTQCEPWNFPQKYKVCGWILQRWWQVWSSFWTFLVFHRNIASKIERQRSPKMSTYCNFFFFFSVHRQDPESRAARAPRAVQVSAWGSKRKAGHGKRSLLCGPRRHQWDQHCDMGVGGYRRVSQQTEWEASSALWKRLGSRLSSSMELISEGKMLRKSKAKQENKKYR